ncbi:MAG TPA: efflux transporter outer membrane subunit [Caldimonas sp.]|jgi:NodT family efflux transporter outer membrane factor (OMF) lipoprotein|nr:efflux transporter outer membrane subunit [Caldimonas sp.]
MSSSCQDCRAGGPTGIARTLTTVVVAVASVLVLALAGCASTDGIASNAKLVAPATLGAAPAAASVAAEWWRGFDDPVLDDLIARATAGNPSLRVAAARTARASANVAAADAARAPLVTGSLDATRQRFSENSLYPPPLAGSVQNTATAQLNGSWELDFFGRNRAQLESAIGSERAAVADADAARVLLAVNVARSYVQLARLLEQRAVLDRVLSQRDEVFSLTRQRVDAGLDTNVELRQSEGFLPETRQQIEATDEQIALARHAIAALLAEPPQRFETLAPKLSTLHPIAVPEVVPADLVGRRADVVAARWRVEAAAGDVAAQRAQFYPNVNLTAFIGLSTLGLDRLIDAGSLQYGVGPAIRLPIFDAGRLRAGLRGRTADLDAAVETYNATLVDAIHDVADQISSTRSVVRQQREQDAALASAEAAYDLATQRYRAGLGSYLTVLNAETNVIAQRRLTTDLRARAIDSQMLLVRALGGGYAAGDDARALASAGLPR